MTAMATRQNIRLTAAMNSGAWRDGLQRAQLQGVTLDFVDVSPIHRAFAPMAREQRFDVSEMAIVTALQAVAYNKPLLILPVTVAARFQHGCLITRKSEAALTVAELMGRRVGVRAYTQTTGVWVRGILQNDHGVPSDAIRWVTQEGAHVAEYQDPPWVERVTHDRPLVDMLRAGEIDAAILGNDLPDSPDLVPVIPNPKVAAHDWYGKHGVIPINHMIAMRKDVALAQPEAVRELWHAIKLAKPVSADGPDMPAIGISANRRALALMLRYCEQQKLLPRTITVDDIFADTIALIGKDAID
jgi:4,5-dihydroxyphthalate decarboxylase